MLQREVALPNQRDTGVGFGRVEPSANLRALAATLFEMYVALTDRGFTESQSLIILNGMLCEAVMTDDPGTETTGPN
jgi:hypothetical protein